jgi:hypothetical protein
VASAGQAPLILAELRLVRAEAVAAAEVQALFSVQRAVEAAAVAETATAQRSCVPM